MKAAVYHAPATITYEERDVPEVGPGEALIKLRVSGLCGTDIHKIRHQTVSGGTVLGHEVAGEIAAVGDGVHAFTIGDAVYAAHHVPCFTCDQCVRGHHSLCTQFKETNFDPGGYAEYFRLSPLHVKHTLHKIPDAVSFEQASMVEPVATVVHAMQMVSVKPGDTALVLGSGPIGVIWAQVLRFMGARNVIVSDISQFRLSKALQLGATHGVNIKSDSLFEAVSDVSHGRGADIVVIAAGVGSLLDEAVSLSASGGQILVFASLPPAQTLDASRFFEAEIKIIGAYSSVPMDYTTAMSLIEQGFVDVEPMFTHRLDLSQLGEAVRIATDPESNALKVLLYPNPSGKTWN